MKNRILAFLLIILFPLYIFAVEGLSTTVSLDYTTQGLESLNVKFTSDGVPATAELQTNVSNFEAYDKLKKLVDPDNKSFEGIRLKTEMTNGKLLGKSAYPCYISWQTYTSNYASISIELTGPLTTNTGESIHWKVYMDPETKITEVADSSVPGSSIPVVNTYPHNFGVTGSRRFYVETYDLLSKPYDCSYSAFIKAKVEAQ